MRSDLSIGVIRFSKTGKSRAIADKSEKKKAPRKTLVVGALVMSTRVVYKMSPLDASDRAQQMENIRTRIRLLRKVMS